MSIFTSCSQNMQQEQHQHHSPQDGGSRKCIEIVEGDIRQHIENGHVIDEFPFHPVNENNRNDKKEEDYDPDQHLVSQLPVPRTVEVLQAGLLYPAASESNVYLSDPLEYFTPGLCFMTCAMPAAMSR